jgi:hypothetical protein
MQRELADAEEYGVGSTPGMQFNIALNYGGRAEIVDAARRAMAGHAPDELDEERFASLLYTAGQPDPDLLIRTSGEMRVSNFLLWQIAYAEIWVTETLWPDFRRRHLLEAIVAYQKRDRRYGGIARRRAEAGGGRGLPAATSACRSGALAAFATGGAPRPVLLAADGDGERRGAVLRGRRWAGACWRRS